MIKVVLNTGGIKMPNASDQHCKGDHQLVKRQQSTHHGGVSDEVEILRHELDKENANR